MKERPVMPENELKPCPFCGNTAPQLMTPDCIPLGGFMVCCPQPGCQAQCRLSGNRDKAIAAWNRRAGDGAREVEPETARCPGCGKRGESNQKDGGFYCYGSDRCCP